MGAQDPKEPQLYVRRAWLESGQAKVQGRAGEVRLVLVELSLGKGGLNPDVWSDLAQLG